MYFRIVFSSIALIFAFTISVFAQQKEPTIKLLNPSFEGIPRSGGLPQGWMNCGSARESDPDTQPGQFRVEKPAQNGISYLGLVVRDNDTRESIAQRLTTPFKTDYCYTFSLWLCKSEIYLSRSSTTGVEANYVTPVKLRIYGGSNYCERGELLAETGEITTMSWTEFKFELKPRKDYAYIMLEAAHKTPTLVPYNGNLLVDNISPMTAKFCGRQVAVVKPKPNTGTNNPPKLKPNSGGVAVASVPNNIPGQYEVTNSKPSSYDRKNLRVGQTIGIEKLYFDADSTRIKKDCIPVLDELYQFMSSNNDLSIEIGGHTNDIPPDEFCDRLSTTRARAVAEYLTNKGISNERVKYRGYGKRLPLFPNVNIDNRRRNQRVEIKILSIGQ